MISQIIATALVTTIFTIVSIALVARAVLDKWLTPKIEELMSEQIEPRINQLVDELIESRSAEIGDMIEDRVRAGVVEGVNELMSPEQMRRTMTRGPDDFFNAVFGNKPKT